MDSARFWDKAARKYAKSAISDPQGYARTRDRMRALLKPHHRVLELGCGTGSTALELADGVASYLGTDVSPQMIAIAQGKLADGAPTQLSFAVTEAGAAPIKGHDVILALNLLHLLPDLEGMLAAAFDALPGGGMFIAKTVLLADSPWWLRGVIPLMRAIGKAPFVRSLDEAELSTLLERCGFTVTETLLQKGMAPRLFCVAVKP